MAKIEYQTGGSFATSVELEQISGALQFAFLRGNDEAENQKRGGRRQHQEALPGTTQPPPYQSQTERPSSEGSGLHSDHPGFQFQSHCLPAASHWESW